MKTPILLAALLLSTHALADAMDVPQLGQLQEALVADVPSGTEANEGGPGFHHEEAINVMVHEADGSAPGTMDAQKKEIQKLLFKKWISSKKTSDGWVITYVSQGMDMSGKMADRYSFSVRRKIGAKSYDCAGALKKKDTLDANVKICSSMRAKG